MLEYFTYKKIKKHKTQKEVKEEAKRLTDSNRDSDDLLEERAHGRLDDRHGKRRDDGRDNDDDRALQAPPVLRPEDETFLEQLLAGEDGPAPPLPPRNYLNEFGLPSDNEGAASASEPEKSEEVAGEKDTNKAGALKTAEKKPGRFALFFSKNKKSNEEGLEPHGVPPAEGEGETKDLSRVLDRLNLSAKNNKVVSTDSSELLQKFTQVFKDLVNGVPTAYDDLAKLVEDRDGTLSKGFDKLPSSLQKLVTQLPDKITGSLAPEILAAAASKQGIKSDAQGGVKGVAKSILMPHNLAELVTKPGAIVGMLRAIVEVLKTRWPAFIGMNVIWSVALTLLLFMLWYCHKRGREVRLEREQSAVAIDGSDRIEELPDDPTLPAPEPRVADVSGRSSSTTPQLSHRPTAQRRDTSGSNRR
ncbi:RING-like domain-containing protein [Hirsutella rhossiliensis]|uniref:RING-like domain-containing protein n=1 Tax=Hirsutella rhossiliensis TaxID=111463 RepID=A0A9P8MYW8_9HYPO|nr:RING-like domain-containing protein [Hirsutella rhossiliensis]KAH0964573.1 RING-like domain-containing protein [Hirsutella rhossiliensis]